MNNFNCLTIDELHKKEILLSLFMKNNFVSKSTEWFVYPESNEVDFVEDYDDDEEDKIISASPIIQQLIDLAKKEPVSNRNWERELDEL